MELTNLSSELLSRTRSLSVLALAFVVLFILACSNGFTGTDQDATGEIPDIIVGAANNKIPANSITDWVSYTDQVSVVTVVSEKRIPANSNDLARGEGLVGREVQLKIESNLWNRPNAPKINGTFNTRVWGWVLNKGREIPFTAEGNTRVEVGQSYVAPLVLLSTSFGQEWVLITNGGSTIPVEDRKLVASNPHHHEVESFVDELQGITVDELAILLAGTAPNPIASQYMDVDPVERVRRVFGLPVEVDAAPRD